MADEERAASPTAVADRPEVKDAVDAAPAVAGDVLAGIAKNAGKQNKKSKKKQDDEDYELEFETPFGKLEFEFEPTAVKQRKEQEKREKAAEDAAKAAAKAEKKAAKQIAKQGFVAADVAPSKGGGKLLPMLLIFAIVAGAIILAVWLFARPGEDEPETVPPEFLNEDAMPQPAPAPQGLAAKAQARIREAIRAGRKASREAQHEQEQKFQDMTR